MTIKTENSICTITLKYWHGGWDAGFDPDCFDDLECNFPMDHRGRDEEDDLIILAGEADTAALIDWWKSECGAANSGDGSDVLDPLSDEARERGDEWVLDVEASPLQ